MSVEHIKDLEQDGVSNCCGAKVYLDICQDCKEHCEVVKEGKEDSRQVRTTADIKKEWIEPENEKFDRMGDNGVWTPEDILETEEKLTQKD